MSSTSGVVRRLGAARSQLVGRGAERALLQRAADDAFAQQRARIVTFVGAPGIGKSRIVEDFLHELESAEGAAPRIYRTRARLLEPAYGMFARLLRARFGLSEPVDPEPDRTRLRAELAKVLEDRKVGDVCYFLGQILDLSFPESPLTRALAEDPAQAQALHRAVLKNFFESDGEFGPLCLVFDDLQLAGEDSLDLLCYLMDQLSGPILILCTTRPELVARSERLFECGRERHARVELAPVTNVQAQEIMRNLLGACQGGPPEVLVNAAVGVAAGTPGLLEQMLSILQDAEVLTEDQSAPDGTWRVDLGKLSSVQLPLTVDDAVTTRIAALSPDARRVLEHAAAMGSVFWLGGLVALERASAAAPEFWLPEDAGDRQEIRSLLADLVSRDYVLELPDSVFSDETEYVFKHNLERERIAVLTSSAACRRYHQTIADWLSQKDGVRQTQEYCAMLAGHLEKAGAPSRAGLAFLEAGDIARQSFAAKKAHEHYKRGLSLLGESDASRRIEALHNHGDVLLVIGRTDDALNAFREMQRLAFRLGLSAKGGAAHNRIGRLHRETGSLGLARQHLDTALILFRTAHDERGIAACHDDIGKLLWTRGEYEQALEQMKTALDMRRSLGDRRSIALSLNNIGLVWMDHGRAGQAAEALEAALTIRREIKDPLGVVESLTNLGRLAVDHGDHQRALELFREALDVAREVGENYRIAAVLTRMGDCHYELGDSEEAIRVLGQAEDLCEELGDKLSLGQAKRVLSRAHLRRGDLRRARESIKHAVDIFGQVRSKSHLATALRTLGEVTGAGAWGAGHEGKAVDYFLRSIAICKEIGNELEVARSYKAFSSYVSESPHYRANTDIQREASTLSAMADEIFERHRILARTGAPVSSSQT